MSPTVAARTEFRDIGGPAGAGAMSRPNPEVQMNSLQRRTRAARAAMGGLLLAATGSVAMAQDFQMDFGRHKRMVKGGQKAGISQASHGRYWLVARTGEGVRISEMADSAGLKVIGAHRDREMTVYQVELSGAPASALAKLRKFPEFFAFEPMFETEKWNGELQADHQERKGRRNRGDARQPIDPMRDTVRVVVSHSLPADADVMAWAASKGLFECSMGGKLALECSLPWDRIEALAADPMVRRIHRKHKGGPLNDIGRASMNMAPLQFGSSSAGFLDTLTPFTSSWNLGARHSGQGVVVGVFDGGVRDLHPDLRISPAIDRRAPLADPFVTTYVSPDHGTHVAGTILGNGQMSQLDGGRPYQWRGVAPLAQLYSFRPDATPRQVDVGNFSWVVMGTTGEYTPEGGRFDNLMANHALGARPIYAFAAGNNGEAPQSSLGYGWERGYFSILTHPKNGIKVGAYDGRTGQLASFSSLGPTRDGRIGPDVVAHGVNVYSTSIISAPVIGDPGVPNGFAAPSGIVKTPLPDGDTAIYKFMSGTSMATPHVTGLLALMVEQWGRVHGKGHADHMWNSTARAILIHTARDMVRQNPVSGANNPDFHATAIDKSVPLSTVYGIGPDWATGYGSVDAARAIDFTGSNRVLEQVATQGTNRTFQVAIPAGTAKFRATLAWDDPGSETYSGVWQKALLNDLDLFLTSPSGAVFRPWVLDASILNDSLPSSSTDGGIDSKVTLEKVQNNPARAGIDSLNNVEVVDLTSPEAGTWTITVRPRSLVVDQNPSLAGTNQDFSLVTDIATGAPAGFIDLDIGITGGSRVQTGNVHTVRSAGNDIWNLTDQFHFAYQTLSGDGSFTAKVTSLSLVSGSLDPWAKAGVMIREKLNGGSRHAMMEVTAANGALFQYRQTENGGCGNTIQSGIKAPYWVRIVRVKDTLTGFLSPDGSTWSQIAGSRVVLPGLPTQLFAGMAVTAHTNNGSVVQGTFDLTSPPVVLPPAPTNLVAVAGSGQISLSWNAVAGATSYLVRRWGSDPIQKITVYNGSSPSFVNTGLTNGVLYNYDVATTNANGTGTPSVPVSAVVGVQLPATPTGLAAVAGNGQVSLSWNAVSGATAYTLHRWTTDSNVRVPVYTGSTPSFSNTGLTNGTTYRYQVMASNTTGGSALSAAVAASPAAPQAWTETDIATWGGSHTVSGSVHTVKGSGTDIWGTSDQFHFSSRTLSGNGSLVARVSSLGATDPWAKAGLMFRESTAGNSRNVMVNLTASNGVLLQRRLNPGESSSNTIVSGKSAPQWLKLTRSGNTFTGYWSADGSTWTQIGSPVTFGTFANSALVGLAVTSHNASSVTTATFDNVSIP